MLLTYKSLLRFPVELVSKNRTQYDKYTEDRKETRVSCFIPTVYFDYTIKKYVQTTTAELNRTVSTTWIIT